MHEISGKLQGLLGSQMEHGKSPLERVSVFYSKLLDFPIPPILLKLPEIHVLLPIPPARNPLPNQRSSAKSAPKPALAARIEP
jgi:hypothetical protein